MILPNRGIRAAAPVILWLLLAAFGGGIVLGPKVKAKLAGKPPTEELAKANARAAAAEQRFEDAKETAQQSLVAQVRNGQEMNAGVVQSLKRAPVGPETQLASQFAAKTELALSLAVGDLSVERQAQIQKIVTGALSDVQAERDEAKRLLAAKDIELQVATAERQKVEAVIPVLKADVAATEQKVRDKQAEVVKYADKAKEESDKVNSIQAQILYWGKWLAGIYIVGHFLLPSLAQEYPNTAALNYLNKTVKSILCSHE